MSEIEAILGRQQLQRLDAAVDHRNRAVDCYRELLASADWIHIPEVPAGIRHSYYKLPMRLGDGIDAERFRGVLRDTHLVENGTVYDPPCHLRPMFQAIPTIAHARFPRAEEALRQQFCPPVHSTISPSEVGQVVDAMTATHSALNA